MGGEKKGVSPISLGKRMYIALTKRDGTTHGYMEGEGPLNMNMKINNDFKVHL